MSSYLFKLFKVAGKYKLLAICLPISLCACFLLTNSSQVQALASSNKVELQSNKSIQALSPQVVADASTITPTITEFLVPDQNQYDSGPYHITSGPDGNLWFTGGESGIGRITPRGIFTKFESGNHYVITAGPDGNMWVTGLYQKSVSRITPKGVITHFPISLNFGHDNVQGANDITSGPDGNLWYTTESDSVGRITPNGASTIELQVPPNTNYPPSRSITTGSDGNLWFTTNRYIGRINPYGTINHYPFSSPNITYFPVPTDGYSITNGPDGNLWFTTGDANSIGRFTITGSVTYFPIPTANSGVGKITNGPDGNLWFTESKGNKIAKITPTGIITEYLIPTSNSSPFGITAGSDCSIWFTEVLAHQIGKLSNVNTIQKEVSNPDFRTWDEDDLYSKGIISSGLCTDITFNISRYYGPVDQNGKLTDATEASSKLHERYATLYLWAKAGGAFDISSLKVNGQSIPNLSAQSVTGVTSGQLVKVQIPVEYLMFPDICKKPDGSTRHPDGAPVGEHCMRNPNSPNDQDLGDGTTYQGALDDQSQFSSIQPTKNQIELDLPKDGSVQAAYLFLNGVRPVLLMSGIDLTNKRGARDTTDEWGTGSLLNGDYQFEGSGDYTINNWIKWLSDKNIPNWNPPRDGTRSVMDQQEFMLAGASFLNRVYGAKKINIIAHSMGGVTSRYFTYNANIANANNSKQVKVDKLITIDSPLTGVNLAGPSLGRGTHDPEYPIIFFQSFPAQADLGPEQLYYSNKQYQGLQDNSVWNGESSKNHLFFAATFADYDYCAYETTLKGNRYCPRNATRKSNGPFINPDTNMPVSDSDGFIELISQSGTQYPKSSVLAYNLGISEQELSTTLPANYGQIPPAPFFCSHKINWFWEYVIEGRPIKCHTWVTHSEEIKTWIDQYAGIFSYQKNGLPLRQSTNNIQVKNIVSTEKPISPQPVITPIITSTLQSILTTTGPISATNIVSTSFVLDPQATNVQIGIGLASGTNPSGVQARLEKQNGTILIDDSPAPVNFANTNSFLTPGSYNLILTAPTLITPTQYLVSVTADSDLAIHTESTRPLAGSPIPGKLKVSLLQGTNNSPVTGALVTATMTIVASNGTTTINTFNLLDNGTSGDTIAGDGHYAANLPTSLTSEFIQVGYIASGVFSGSQFTRETSELLRARSGELKFNGNYSWLTASGNITGTVSDIDTINFTAGVNISQAGNFMVEAALAANDGTVVSTQQTAVYLPTGAGTVTVSFDGSDLETSQRPGPYRIISLKGYLLNDTETRETDEVSNLAAIPVLALNLNQFSRPAIRYNGGFSEAATNPDGSGNFQKLQVTIPLDIAKTGVYSYSLLLKAPDGSFVGATEGQVNLGAGATTPLTLTFNGAIIRSSGRNGPYSITNLVISDPVSNTFLLFEDTLGQTAAYQASQFSANCSPIKVNLTSDSSSAGACQFSLRMAVSQASLLGNTVTFDPTAVTGPITLSSPLTIPPGVGLSANCSSPVTLNTSTGKELLPGGRNLIEGLLIYASGNSNLKIVNPGVKIKCTRIVKVP